MEFQYILNPPTQTNNTTTLSKNRENNEMKSVSVCDNIIVIGDKEGQLYLYVDNILEQRIQAHDQEVVSLDIINLKGEENDSQSRTGIYIVSGSRDRLIHIFNLIVLRNYQMKLVQTIDKHQSSVTKVLLLTNKINQSLNLSLLSCGGDRMFYIHSYVIQQ